jgi:Holliday junction resolvase RusA-like endonuclease
VSVVQFTVPGTPVAKARARVTHWGTFTPAETVRAERSIALYARTAMRGRDVFDEAVELSIVAVFEEPARRTLKERALPCAAFKPTKPDSDNLAKTVLDACNGIVWQDDARVAVMHIAKIYGNEPELRISVRPVDPRSWPFCADARGRLRQEVA